jgi:thiamine biosynthesis lipoprotein
MRRFTFLLFLAFYSFILLPEKEIHKIQLSGYAQGTTYHITYYSSDSSVLKKDIDSVLNSIDSSLSIYKPYSLITAFNQSDTGCVINQHFINVVQKSLEVYQATNGISDITVAPLVEAWGFGIHKHDSLPDSSFIKGIKKCIGSNLLHLKGSILYKEKPCVHIDVNGIAQGYSVDVLANYLEQYGIKNYMVELGGEIRVKGRKPDGTKMRIGIESPNNDEIETDMMQRVVEIDSGGITTSGSYRKYYESNGKRITHIVDPRTGYTIQNEMISVTVYAKDAITADAFDNALMVMGVDSALQFVEKRKDMEAYIIYKNKSGNIVDTASKGFYKLFITK